MNSIARGLLSTLHFSGADAMLAPFTRGLGAILKLHHVRPEHPGRFEPNRNLKVTPEFLERTITLVRQQGFDIISLDEAQFRLLEGAIRDKPFVCFTFDDGYRDTLDYAYPIFRRHGLSFAVYVATDYADGHGDLWWLALEAVIACAPVLDLKIDLHGALRWAPAYRLDEAVLWAGAREVALGGRRVPTLAEQEEEEDNDWE